MSFVFYFYIKDIKDMKDRDIHRFISVANTQIDPRRGRKVEMRKTHIGIVSWFQHMKKKKKKKNKEQRGKKRGRIITIIIVKKEKKTTACMMTTIIKFLTF